MYNCTMSQSNNEFIVYFYLFNFLSCAAGIIGHLLPITYFIMFYEFIKSEPIGTEQTQNGIITVIIIVGLGRIAYNKMRVYVLYLLRKQLHTYLLYCLCYSLVELIGYETITSLCECELF